MCSGWSRAQFVPQVKGLKQEQMEQLLDRFDTREEHAAGHVLINQGDVVGGHLLHSTTNLPLLGMRV